MAGGTGRYGPSVACASCRLCCSRVRGDGSCRNSSEVTAASCLRSFATAARGFPPRHMCRPVPPAGTAADFKDAAVDAAMPPFFGTAVVSVLLRSKSPSSFKPRGITEPAIEPRPARPRPCRLPGRRTGSCNPAVSAPSQPVRLPGSGDTPRIRLCILAGEPETHDGPHASMPAQGFVRGSL